MDKKTWPTHILPTRDPPHNKRTTQTESKGLKKNIPSKWTGKRPRVLRSDKIDFKTKAIKRDIESHFIMLKGRIHQEEINIVNICVPNMGAPKYIRKILEDFMKDIDSTHLY